MVWNQVCVCLSLSVLWGRHRYQILLFFIEDVTELSPSDFHSEVYDKKESGWGTVNSMAAGYEGR